LTKVAKADWGEDKVAAPEFQRKGYAAA
jgi:hypothetical protein